MAPDLISLAHGYAGQTVGLRMQATSTNVAGTFADFDDFHLG